MPQTEFMKPTPQGRKMRDDMVARVWQENPGRTPYQQGTMIDYDPMMKHVRLMYRGASVTLPDTYDTVEAARAAAAEYCRQQGWKE